MNPRRLLVFATAVVCILAVTATLQFAGRLPGHSGVALAQSEPEPGTIQFVWTTSVNGFRSASFSPDDTYFTVVGNPSGTITLRSQNGKSVTRVWQVAAPGVTKAVVGPGGKAVVAFAAMDPTRQAITIIRGNSKATSINRIKLDGAIWDAKISGDGATAAVVTGAHSLYIVPLIGDKQPQHYPLMGAGNSIAISHDGSFIASGTWNQSGVTCYTSNGAELWHYPKQRADVKPIVNRLFEAQIAKDSPYILGVSYANAQQGSAQIYLWRKTGKGSPMWTYPLGPDNSDPQTKISANGTHVAVVYLHKIPHGDQSVQVRQLVMLDRYGNELWGDAKGGMLMSPNLVAISPDGNTVTVTDGQRALYNFDSDGRISAPSKTMSAPIHSTITSDDGRYVLVYADDGTLTLVRPV